MKKYDIFDAASWLLDETYSIYEDAKKEAEENEELEDTVDSDDDSDYSSEEDDTDVDNSDLAEPVADDEDSEEDDGELTDLDAEEETEDEDTEADEDQDVFTRLDVIEDKIDALSDKTPKADDDETFDLDLSNPVCPCCGARLNIIDAVPDTEDFGPKDSDEEADIDGISDLLDGEGPEETETEGEDITAMDDSLDNVEDIGYGDNNEYVSLDSITDDEDDDED